MNILHDVDLQGYNTLGVPSRAAHLAVAQSVDDIRDALAWARERKQPVFVLGAGSNLVVAPQLQGLAILPRIMGKEVVARTDTWVDVRFGAGENWHQVVEWCLENQLYGLENLALIPGTVGAAPVQNIGAYGVELCQFFHCLRALDRETGELQTVGPAACEFGYRESVFKNAWRDRYVITQVTLRLPCSAQTNVSYRALRDALEGQEATPQQVFSAVCQLRSAKLPDPNEIPNCGSFFKNPIVSHAHYQFLSKRFPGLVAFDATQNGQSNDKKLAAAWLIEQAGWKGRQNEQVSVHSQQALVLTNPQRAPSEAVMRLAEAIQYSVRDKFDVSLEVEPQLLGWS